MRGSESRLPVAAQPPLHCGAWASEHLVYRWTPGSQPCGEDRCLWIIEKPILGDQGELCNPSVFSNLCYSLTQEAEENVLSRGSEI